MKKLTKLQWLYRSMTEDELKGVSYPTLRNAVNRGEIPHSKTSHGTRAHILVYREDVEKYLKGLKNVSTR
jgi:excisionase family DNA binding protein